MKNQFDNILNGFMGKKEVLKDISRRQEDDEQEEENQFEMTEHSENNHFYDQ